MESQKKPRPRCLKLHVTLSLKWCLGLLGDKATAKHSHGLEPAPECWVVHGCSDRMGRHFVVRECRGLGARDLQIRMFEVREVSDVGSFELPVGVPLLSSAVKTNPLTPRMQ